MNHMNQIAIATIPVLAIIAALVVRGLWRDFGSLFKALDEGHEGEALHDEGRFEPAAAAIAKMPHRQALAQKRVLRRAREPFEM